MANLHTTLLSESTKPNLTKIYLYNHFRTKLERDSVPYTTITSASGAARSTKDAIAYTLDQVAASEQSLNDLNDPSISFSPSIKFIDASSSYEIHSDQEADDSVASNASKEAAVVITSAIVTAEADDSVASSTSKEAAQVTTSAIVATEKADLVTAKDAASVTAKESASLAIKESASLAAKGATSLSPKGAASVTSKEANLVTNNKAAIVTNDESVTLKDANLKDISLDKASADRTEEEKDVQYLEDVSLR